jgi:hypothetical protein
MRYATAHTMVLVLNAHPGEPHSSEEARSEGVGKADPAPPLIRRSLGDAAHHARRPGLEVPQDS